MRARILIVEDHAAIANITALLCAAEGHEPTVVGNGVEALSALEGDAFDLAIVDVAMPLMDGIELTRRVRADARTAELPILGFTAIATPEMLRGMIDAGMSEVVTKPYEPAGLRARIRHILAEA